jgi:uncharacterized protein (TIGR02231 family)
MKRSFRGIALWLSALVVTGVAAASQAAAPPADKPAAEKPPASLPGQVTQVTLYRGQALVTRTISLDGPKGGAEVVVGDLPEQIVPDSLFAEGSEGVEIRAVRYRSRAVGAEPRDEVRKLDEEIEVANEQLKLIERQQQVLGKQTAYLDQMENFVLPTAKTDLARGFLDAAALEKLTQLSFGQREAAAAKTAELEKAAKEVNKALELLQRKRAELTGGAQKAVREALLFVEKGGPGPQAVRLNYLVSGCGWSPTYTFRAGKDRKEVAVECSALIQQMTGEDWGQVKLTLSTASPALAAAGPGLGPFPVSLVATAQAGRPSEKDVAAQVQAIRGRQSAAIVQSRGATKLSETIGSSWTANAAANEFQALELGVGKEVLVSALESHGIEGPSLSYQLPNAVSLASRADQQMVRIVQTSFKSTFYYVATPVLTSYVYREAELVNQGADDLLAGPIAVYLDGRFVGRSEIPTVARGQTFVVGFGADPQLRARRELVNRTEAVQGGNRELSFKYRLVVENFKDEAAPLRLFDRMPYSDRPTDVRIKLGELKDPLSEDALYVRTERPKNILRWDVNVPAAATAEKARLIEYGFTIEFDRQLAVNIPGVTTPADASAAPAASPQLQQDFERMQRSKLAR